jgi:hypothetical protein
VTGFVNLMVFMSQPVPIPRDIVDPQEKGNEGLSRREMHACALGGQFRFRIPQLHIPNHLPASAPDGLEEAVLLCEPVEAVVGLTHGANETADGVGLVVAGVAAVLVNLANAELDRGVVLGPDDASGGRAFAGDVKVDELSAFVLHFDRFVC